jgi:hypothetical protein
MGRKGVRSKTTPKVVTSRFKSMHSGRRDEVLKGLVEGIFEVVGHIEEGEVENPALVLNPSACSDHPSNEGKSVLFVVFGKPVARFAGVGSG